MNIPSAGSHGNIQDGATEGRCSPKQLSKAILSCCAAWLATAAQNLIQFSKLLIPRWAEALNLEMISWWFEWITVHCSKHLPSDIAETK